MKYSVEFILHFNMLYGEWGRFGKVSESAESIAWVCL